MKLIHQVTQDLKMYHKRAMRRDFADRFKNVCSVSPVVVREIYQELTGDLTAAPSAVEKIVQARLQLALDTEDSDIVYDLCHHNPGRRPEFDAFWDATKGYIESRAMQAVDSRRHGQVCNMATVVSTETSLTT